MWSVEFLNDTVRSEMRGQPKDIREKFRYITTLIKTRGLEQLRVKHAKHLEGDLWEMRMRGKDGIARAIYIAYFGKRVIILRVFTKKKQKTPRREIELALNRMKEIR